MMGSRIDQRPQGFCVLDERISPDNLAPNDGTANNSEYTQAGPRPGQFSTDDPFSEALIHLSGAQIHPIDVQSQLGGNPTRGGATWAYKRTDEVAADDWRGWRPPNQPVKWEALFWSDVATRDSLDVEVMPKSQEPIVAYDGYFRRWDNASQQWLSEVAVFPAIAADEACCVAVIPENGRIFYFITQGLVNDVDIRVYVSDDGGLTFRLWALSRVDLGVADGSTDSHASAAYQDGQIMLTFMNATSSLSVQLASTDLGVSWSYIASHSTTSVGLKPHLVAMPTGGFGIFLTEQSPDELRFRRVGSAFTDWTDATDVLVMTPSSGGSIPLAQSGCGWVDPDGTLWGMLMDPDDNRLRLAVSTDDGNTFQAMRFGAFYPRTDDIQLTNYAGAPFQGGVCLVHNWIPDTSTTGGSVGAWFLGGWTNWEHSRFQSTGGSLEDIRRRWSFGLADAGINAPVDYTGTWLPLDLPEDFSMTGPPDPLFDDIGAGGKVLAGGYLELQANTGQTSYYSKEIDFITLDSGDSAHLFAEFKVSAGGALTGANAGFLLRWADGSDMYELELSATTTQFRLTDGVANAEIFTETVDMTAGIVLEARLEGDGTYQFQWRTRGMKPKWNLSGGSVTNDNVTPQNYPLFAWGTVFVAGVDTTSEWFQVQVLYNDEITQTQRASGVGGGLGSDTMRGRWLSRLPMPISDIGTDACSSFISLARGPIGNGEDHQAAPAYDFPVSALFPQVAPSPDQPWRSVNDTDDQIITLNLPGIASTLDGQKCLALGVIRTNCSAIVLESFVGVSWTTLGTWDASEGMTGLDYSLTGNLLIPPIAAGPTPLSGRHIHNQEFREGYFHGVDTGGSWVSKIASHTPGRFRTTVDKANTVPCFRLEDPSGASDPTGTGRLSAHTGVLVIPQSPNLVHTKLRLRIVAADNPTAEGYFQIGSVLIGAVSIMGRQWGRGWSRAMIPRTTTRTSAAGTIRRKQEGRSARRWVMSWQDAQDASNLRQEEAPDFLAAGAGPAYAALATWNDVWTNLQGLIILSKGLSLPVLALAEIPGSNITITDPTMFLYGMVTGTAQANNVLGDEGDSELMRVESVNVEELV